MNTLNMFQINIKEIDDTHYVHMYIYHTLPNGNVLERSSSGNERCNDDDIPYMYAYVLICTLTYRMV